ncbi:MAG: HIT domain-containing protein [Capsulimonadaceae bacterium]|nr:HIT domain-containing protein [Capsulimonadaceae bacterium]
MANKPPAGPSGCIFCDKPAQAIDAENLIVHRGERAFVLMNLYPYNNGHLMIAPYKHTSTLGELGEETMLEIMTLTVAAQQALGRAFGPHGYNIGMNLGRVAGAGIADHLHLHIVPRWNGDSNFMTVTGETRVLPEGLESTYQKILNAWRGNE